MEAQTLMMKERKIGSCTYHAGSADQIRESARSFANTLRERLITFTEAYDGGFLKVTVYFWEEE